MKIKMRIPFRIRFAIEMFGAVACGFSVARYGILPMGIVFVIFVMIFANVLFPDGEDFRS